jgi:hypothetical protein
MGRALSLPGALVWLCIDSVLLSGGLMNSKGWTQGKRAAPASSRQSRPTEPA